MGSGKHNQIATNEQFIECYDRLKVEGYGFKSKMAKELGVSPAVITNREKHLMKNGLIALELKHR